ncbi:MAG: hypothetical protein KIT76_17205 [Pseudolabrys sp.]|nr:hypothetical protein [Pseudolabrys sp.]
MDRYLAWLADAGAAAPSADAWPAGFVQAGYFAAVGAVRNFIETRLCALRREFWCSTHSETHDQWMIEYGLPDACDPFPDLCTKVAAIGGTRCEYYVAIAEGAGWSIDCSSRRDQCGVSAGAGKAGRARPGVRVKDGILLITVFLDDSPAYAGGPRTMPLAGKLKAGRPLSCGPNIGPLVCLLERIVHAEIEILYQEVSND